MPDTRASNPTSSGPSLLDKSTARPADVDMAIFEKKQAQSGSSTSGGSQKSQGAVNPSYLEECRRDNPAPADEKTAKRTVTLSDCRIDTPQEDLATDQPFKMSCVATSSDGKPVRGPVIFRLFVTHPDSKVENTCHSAESMSKDGRFTAEGTLISPNPPIEWGAELKYHVVAEHTQAAEKAESGVVDVVGYMPPKPVAVWHIPLTHFHENTVLLNDHFSQAAVEIADAISRYDNPAIHLYSYARMNDHEHSAVEVQVSIAHAMTHNPNGWWQLIGSHIESPHYENAIEQMVLAYTETNSRKPKESVTSTMQPIDQPNVVQQYMERIVPMPINQDIIVPDFVFDLDYEQDVSSITCTVPCACDAAPLRTAATIFLFNAVLPSIRARPCRFECSSANHNQGK
jgi:hypothetical protein